MTKMKAASSVKSNVGLWIDHQRAIVTDQGEKPEWIASQILRLLTNCPIASLSRKFASTSPAPLAMKYRRRPKRRNRPEPNARRPTSGNQPSNSLCRRPNPRAENRAPNGFHGKLSIRLVKSARPSYRAVVTKNRKPHNTTFSSFKNTVRMRIT